MRGLGSAPKTASILSGGLVSHTQHLDDDLVFVVWIVLRIEVADRLQEFLSEIVRQGH